MSAPAKRVTLLSADPSNDPDDGGGMEFRLTYEGPLYATQRDPLPGKPPKRAEHKRDLRACFHRQLKTLWKLPPLNEVEDNFTKPQLLLDDGGPGFVKPAVTEEELARAHAKPPFRFVPLVTAELDLLCGLDILYLRADMRPGAVLYAGDIDNRVKTLIDALRIPEAGERYELLKPEVDEEPYFYCLLEDDKVVSKITVDTDILLDPHGATDDHWVNAVITVKIRPYSFSPYSMHFL